VSICLCIFLIIISIYRAVKVHVNVHIIDMIETSA